jgi:hypothetical protein
MPDKEKAYTQQELADIAAELLRGLKHRGLMVFQLRRIAEYMLEAVEHITYGE